MFQFPDACNSQGGARLQLGTCNPVQVPHVGDRDPGTCVVTLLDLGSFFCCNKEIEGQDASKGQQRSKIYLHAKKKYILGNEVGKLSKVIMEVQIVTILDLFS